MSHTDAQWIRQHVYDPVVSSEELFMEERGWENRGVIKYKEEEKEQEKQHGVSDNSDGDDNDGYHGSENVNKEKQKKEKRKQGKGALTLEYLVRRKIVKDLLENIDEDLLRRTPWDPIGKKIWRDIEVTGQDNFVLWKIFVSAYGRDSSALDFMAADGQEKQCLPKDQQWKRPGPKEKHNCSDSEEPKWDYDSGEEDKRFQKEVSEHMVGGYTDDVAKLWVKIMAKAFLSEEITLNKRPRHSSVFSCPSLRFREHPIWLPYPSWASLSTHLSCQSPSPIPSFLTVLELNHPSTPSITSWRMDDLRELGNINTLAVLSIHGPYFQQKGTRIIVDRHFDVWALGAKGTLGEKFKNLRILIIQDIDFCSLQRLRPPMEQAKNFFQKLNYFPKLAVVSLTSGLQIPFDSSQCPEQEGKQEARVKMHNVLRHLRRAGVPHITKHYELYGSNKYLEPRTYHLDQERVAELKVYAEQAGWCSGRLRDVVLRRRPPFGHLLRPWATKDLARACAILVDLGQRSTQRDVEEEGAKKQKKEWRVGNHDSGGSRILPVFLNPHFLPEAQRLYDGTIDARDIKAKCGCTTKVRPDGWPERIKAPVVRELGPTLLEKLSYAAAREFDSGGQDGYLFEDGRVVFEKDREGKFEICSGEREKGDGGGGSQNIGGLDERSFGVSSGSSGKLREGEMGLGRDVKRPKRGKVKTEMGVLREEGRSVRDGKKQDVGTLLSEFMY